MEHLSFNFQLLPILIGLSGVVILVMSRNRISKNTMLRSFWVSGLVLFGLYFLLMIGSTLETFYSWNYKNEINPNDTGRQLAFIVAAIFLCLVSFFVLVVGLLRYYVELKKI